jgi:hypothetical protein
MQVYEQDVAASTKAISDFVGEGVPSGKRKGEDS